MTQESEDYARVAMRLREYAAAKDRDAFNALCAIRSQMILAALDLAASRTALDELAREDIAQIQAERGT